MDGRHLEAPRRGVTLNSLKDELYSLQMRMLLAMRNRDEAAQESIRKELERVQMEIDRMCLGGGYRR